MMAAKDKNRQDRPETEEAMNENEQNEIIDNDSTDSETAEQNRGFHINIHILLRCAIVLIIGFSAYTLYIWNKGVPSDYDPNYQTTDFDIEPLDNIIPLAPDKLEGHEDDGVTTILCLGNDPMTGDSGKGGVADWIAAKTNANVYNGAFTDTTIAAQYPTYNDWYMIDGFSFTYVATSLASGDFDAITQAATYYYDESFLTTTTMLASLDMNSVDVICIMYDGRDYINKHPCDNPNEPNDIITYTGALRTGIEAIQEAYPHIRIVVMSHTFCHTINEEGNYENGDRTDLGNGTLSHYLQRELDVCMDYGVSFIDNFYGSVNEDNYLEYMTDYIHFNDAGRELLADRFVQCIFPELVQEQ